MREKKNRMELERWSGRIMSSTRKREGEKGRKERRKGERKGRE
jgi:hypothetical protein